MKHRWIPFLLVFIAAFAVAVSAKDSPGPALAPHFVLPTDAGTLDSDALKGSVVLVDFWASWCGPCQQSFPWLADMDKHYGPKGLKIVAVNLDKKHVLAEKFLHEHAAPFTVAFDPLGDTAKQFNVSGMPSSFLIDRDGKVIATHVGFNAKKSGELEGLIAKACS